MNNNESCHKTSINWYPGHMAKTKRLIKENLSLIDIVYEVIDARIPYSSKIKDLDELIGDKPRILIMSKYDLCDDVYVQKWNDYYSNMGYYVVKLNLINGDVNPLLKITSELVKKVNEKRIAKGMKPRIGRILVTGIPNVGKSTLINKLVGKKATKVGDKPGITKELSWIRINKDLELLDSPGILWPKLDNQLVALNLATMSAIKEEILPTSEVAIHILEVLYEFYPSILLERYGIDFNPDNEIERVLTIIGNKRGVLSRGGEINYEQIYLLLIHDLRSGRMGRVCFDNENIMKTLQ